MKHWKPIPYSECPECGSELEVFSKFLDSGLVANDETVRCSNIDCKLHKKTDKTVVCDWDNVMIEWDETK